MRLFTAIDPPIAVCEELAAWARAQRGESHGMRLIEPANIHLTLAFLGTHEGSEIDSIVGAMTGAAQRCGTVGILSVGEPLVLPPRQPRVLATTVPDPEGALARLQEELALALFGAIGWSEQRRFRPHLTLARLARDAQLPAAFTPVPETRFECGEIKLYRSHLSPSGARYELLESVSLY